MEVTTAATLAVIQAIADPTATKPVAIWPGVPGLVQLAQ